MAPSLVRLYEQIPEPKYVIAMGACTITGGMFSTDSYSTVPKVQRMNEAMIDVIPTRESLHEGAYGSRVVIEFFNSEQCFEFQGNRYEAVDEQSIGDAGFANGFAANKAPTEMGVVGAIDLPRDGECGVSNHPSYAPYLTNEKLIWRPSS
ncbi:NAD(P)H-quinone oxidoreductase subunit K, chloroplastic-like [Solanum dulcamara]|uniref:NAD(P)H-quinone oxidoreductase subunit K, chloroplastic-like n=1 Tax=Solanum dulcamara TaxID=45834 RepID=UPI002486AEF4|nr:NAD(P)H-quinone oxidoreductase subunit K, chloroplastic-like [Solanum dulcamara]